MTEPGYESLQDQSLLLAAMTQDPSSPAIGVERGYMQRRLEVSGNKDQAAQETGYLVHAVTTADKTA